MTDRPALELVLANTRLFRTQTGLARGTLPYMSPEQAAGEVVDLRSDLYSATASLYEQARSLRKRAAWSDLRKGVIIGAIGFAMTVYSMLDDGSPNGLGLVLLFVGIGFVVLWYLEDRQGEERQGTPTSRSGGA